MNYDETIATFPKNTVIIAKRDGEVARVSTADYYASRGKSYNDCIAALNKPREDNVIFEILQDAVIYWVASRNEELEKELKKYRDGSTYVEKIQNIVCELQNLVDEMED